MTDAAKSVAARRDPAKPGPVRSASGAGLPLILAIGASTGGPKALADILAALPGDLPAAVLVVQHMDPEFNAGLNAWLADQSALPLVAARPGEAVRAGHVYLARGGDHLVLTGRGVLGYTDQPKDSLYRPSVDVLFESLARDEFHTGVAVLLTGMGRDGARGLLALRRAGWRTIGQDAGTCAVYGMPKAALELGAVEMMLPLPAIAATAVNLLRRHAAPE